MRDLELHLVSNMKILKSPGSLGTYVAPNITLPGASKSLNCKNLPFFHLCLITALYNRDTFTSMYLKLIYIMTIEVADWLHLISGSCNLYFVAFHGFLDGSSDVRHPDVNAGFLNIDLVCLSG